MIAETLNDFISKLIECGPIEIHTRRRCDA